MILLQFISFIFPKTSIIEYLQSSPVGTTIFNSIKATDIDAGVNGAVEYFIIEGDATDRNDTVSTADGYGTFAISYPHQGHVSYFSHLLFNDK